MEDFQYVVERKEQDPICFSSKVTRDTNPIGKGVSAFQRRYASELFKNVGPSTYDTNILGSCVPGTPFKPVSKRGVGGLAAGASRFSDRIFTQVPSPTRYYPKEFPKPITRSKAPFGVTVKRKFPLFSKTPGVGSYDICRKKCHRTPVAYNFGKPAVVPAVEVICTPNPIHKCAKCSDMCATEYWHYNRSTFLCHLCMMEEKYVHEMYTESQLQKYVRIRTCYLMHLHEGTTAAVRLMTPQDINARNKVENYLNIFIDKFRK